MQRGRQPWLLQCQSHPCPPAPPWEATREPNTSGRLHRILAGAKSSLTNVGSPHLDAGKTVEDALVMEIFEQICTTQEVPEHIMLLVKAGTGTGTSNTPPGSAPQPLEHILLLPLGYCLILMCWITQSYKCPLQYLELIQSMTLFDLKDNQKSVYVSVKLAG